MNESLPKDISGIYFGIYSPEEIDRMAVCTITNNKLSGPESVYDLRMGPLENNTDCVTCSLPYKGCPGHMSKIILNQNILHPLHLRMILSYLKVICFNCNNILITKDQLVLWGYDKYFREIRFEKIIKKVEKINICNRCKTDKEKISLFKPDLNFYIISKVEKKIVKILMEVDHIKTIFENIPDESIKLLGFDPKYTHPKNFVLSILPVIPTRARPFIISENMICDDDITTQYIEIIKANKHLAKKDLPEVKKVHYIQKLKFRIKTLFDNSKSKAKCTNGRPLKGIKERLTGKEGIVRENLMGKRVGNSCRTVISSDPTLRIDEVGVPKDIAKILVKPVTVCNYNIDYLTKEVNEGRANFVIRDEGKIRINLSYALYKKGTSLLYGDIIIRGNTELEYNKNITLKQGDIIKRGNEKIVPEIGFKKSFNLKLGDIVELQAKNGDIILMNRQPTLHKGSMIAFKMKIMPGKTLRINTAVTSSYNADFDGDEMNGHFPYNVDAESELINIASSKNHIMSGQASKPNIIIVQDHLLESFLLTTENKDIPKEMFFNIVMNIETVDKEPVDILKKLCHIRKVLRELNLSGKAYTSRGLISMILPNDLKYEFKNNANPKEPILKIYKGVLYEGALTKAVLGKTHNSLIQILYKEYGQDVIANFIDNIQFLTTACMIQRGFSIGFEDCVATKVDTIQDYVKKYFIEAKEAELVIQHPEIRERRINSSLNKAKDIGLKIAKEALKKDNNFIQTVTSGSKGDFFNIAQITGLLGQQNVGGKRISKILNKGYRTLSHYSFEINDIEKEFESRGFIRSSFVKGLNPKEFWFHAASGREGVSDTAMKTANTGYLQRRMVKFMEDIQVKYDGTVRNSVGYIIQFNYGEDCLDTTKTVSVNGKQQFCNVKRIIDSLEQN